MNLEQPSSTVSSNLVLIPDLVSVIVLNWNGGEEVIRCLRHVLDQTYPQIEIILVDNGSTDGSLARIRATIPDERIQIVENADNLGYATGMNIGLRHSRGEFAVLLNQDALLPADFVAMAIGLLQEDKGLCMVAPKVFDLDAEGIYGTQVTHCGWMMRWHLRPLNNPVCDERREVFGPSFGGAVIRRAALEDVKCGFFNDYFDEDYFAYHEDIDLCFRLVLRGWRTLYDPTLIMYHSRGSATGGDVRTLEKPPYFQRHIFKNRCLTIVKNVPLSLFLKALPFVVFAELALVAYILVKSPSSLRFWIGGWWDAIHLLPKAYRRRQYIQRRVTITAKEFQRYFLRP